MAIVHPYVSAQDEDSMHTNTSRVSRPNLQPRRYEDHAERAGLQMTFVSVYRPLSAYTADDSRSLNHTRQER